MRIFRMKNVHISHETTPPNPLARTIGETAMKRTTRKSANEYQRRINIFRAYEIECEQNRWEVGSSEEEEAYERALNAIFGPK